MFEMPFLPSSLVKCNLKYTSQRPGDFVFKHREIKPSKSMNIIYVIKNMIPMSKHPYAHIGYWLSPMGGNVLTC